MSCEPATLPAAARPFLTAARADRNMTCRQMAVLAWVAANPGRSTRGVALALGFSKPVVHRATYELEARGLMRVATDPDDRRLRRLSATPAGRTLLAEAAP